MKNNLISFISLLIFLHTVTNHLNPTEAKTSEHDPVLDIDGDELLVGNAYDIASTFRPGSGIDLQRLPDRGCGFSVSQLVLGEGLPIFFSLVNSKSGDPVLESTDLLVNSPARIRIGCDFLWQVAYDESTEQQFIITEGIAGSPVSEGSKYFRIKKNESGDYKFVFCPKVSDSNVELCKDVGLYFQDGVRRLALGGQRTFTFRFRKYPSTEVSVA